MRDAAMPGSRGDGTARKLLRAYRIFCVAFAAFLLVYAGTRIGLLRARHQEEARTGFQAVRAGTRTALAAYDARDDAYFSAVMRELARQEGGLLLLAVYEPGGGVYYFLAREPGLFPVPPAPTADMVAVPSYHSPPLTTLRLISTFSQGDGNRKVTVEALYRVLGSADLHRLGREIVYILLVFLIATATMLLVLTSVSGSAPARAPRRPPENREPPPRPPVPQPQTEARPEPEPEPEPQPEPRPARPVAAEPAAVRKPAQATPEPRKAAAKSFYSEVTGLVYQDYLANRLRSEIDRAAASDQDMALAMLDVDGLAAIPGHERVYASIAGRLRETFPFRDLVFEREGGYAVIIPDINLDKALERLEDLRLRIAASPVEGRSVTVSVGIAARNGRLIGEETLLKEASHSLAKAIKDGANQVVAFRADPDKFRRVLAK
jgi:diguanylate cyclase (GGDEF)-like protein